MFKGKTAWFSGSVGKRVTSFWVSEGGALASWKTADYLFSADASYEDTKSQDDYETVASPNKVCSCCEMQQYPVNNMILGYVYIDQMKKYSGELYDFLPSLRDHNFSRSNDVTPPHCHKEM